MHFALSRRFINFNTGKGYPFPTQFYWISNGFLSKNFRDANAVVNDPNKAPVTAPIAIPGGPKGAPIKAPPYAPPKPPADCKAVEVRLLPKSAHFSEVLNYSESIILKVVMASPPTMIAGPITGATLPID